MKKYTVLLSFIFALVIFTPNTNAQTDDTPPTETPEVVKEQPLKIKDFGTLFQIRGVETKRSILFPLRSGSEKTYSNFITGVVIEKNILIMPYKEVLQRQYDYFETKTAEQATLLFKDKKTGLAAVRTNTKNAKKVKLSKNQTDTQVYITTKDGTGREKNINAVAFENTVSPQAPMKVGNIKNYYGSPVLLNNELVGIIDGVIHKPDEKLTDDTEVMSFRIINRDTIEKFLNKKGFKVADRKGKYSLNDVKPLTCKERSDEFVHKDASGEEVKKVCKQKQGGGFLGFLQKLF